MTWWSLGWRRPPRHVAHFFSETLALYRWWYWLPLRRRGEEARDDPYCVTRLVVADDSGDPVMQRGKWGI